MSNVNPEFLEALKQAVLTASAQIQALVRINGCLALALAEAAGTQNVAGALALAGDLIDDPVGREVLAQVRHLALTA